MRERTHFFPLSHAQGMEEEVKAFALEPMVKILRILNTIRTEEIGIPLSISQYQILTPQILINRLLNRFEFIHRLIEGNFLVRD